MIDLTGQKFGRLLCLSATEEREPTNGTVKWKCLCDCGEIIFVNSNNLRTGNTRSCGCLRRRKHNERN